LSQETERSVKEKLKICLDIAEGLLYLESNNICHRDMKLDNIMITQPTLSAVIIDFGLASKLNENKIARLTKHSGMGGNIGHIAPEVANSYIQQSELHGDNEYFDVNYSKQPSFELGCLCYEIFTLQHPYGNYPQGFANPPHLSVDINSVDFNILPNISPLREAVYSLLHGDPNYRAQLCEAFVKIRHYSNNPDH